MVCYAVAAAAASSFLILVTLANSIATTTSNGNIGCLFSDTLCKQDEEWCFNDVAFGKCLPVYGKINEEDLQRYKFGLKELQILEREIQRLFLLGYRWSHTYTQCVVQAVLQSIKVRSDFDISNCNLEIDPDLEGALKAIEGEEMEHIDPDKLAIIRFNPSNKNPHSDYADELYYPPVEEELVPSHRVQQTGTQHQGSPSVGAGVKGPVGNIGGKQHHSSKDDGELINKDDHSNYIPLRSETSAKFFPDHSRNSYQPMEFHDYMMDSPQEIPSLIQEGEFLHPEDIIKERLAFPPAMPMYNEDSGFEPIEVSEKDYDYDLFFHSPYATPPKLSRMFKRRKDDENDYANDSYEDKPIQPINLRTLAHLLSGDRNGKDANINEMIRGTGMNLNEKRFPENNIGFFRDTPVHPSFRDLEEAREPIYGVYTPYDKTYGSRLLPPPPRSELPELEPPKPAYDENYSPKELHPPYIKSDYDKPKESSMYEASDSSMNSGHGKGSNPYPGNDMFNTNKPQDSYVPHYYDYGQYPYYYDYDYMYEEPIQSKNLPRDERLDVKKPGPFFKTTNDYAFDYRSEDELQGGYPGPWNPTGVAPQQSDENADLLKKLRERTELDGSSPFASHDKNKDLLLTEEGYVDAVREASRIGSKERHTLAAHHTHASKNQENGENRSGKDPTEPDSYVYITINREFHSEREATELLKIIFRLIKLDKKYIQNLSFLKNQLKFKLDPELKGITAAEFAEKTEELRDAIREKTNIEIIQSGVGTKNAISAVVYSSGKRQMLAVAAIICGVCAALLVAATALFFLRRQSRSKAKLQGISAHDSEASKDYQDLCRARMSGKSEGKDGMGTGHGVGSGGSATHTPSHRVSSLSKDSEQGNNSPSSRSSTSSWSEEPVISNMDISTGHMVLSYMEDHLKNKDRLEQEWIALCAYEAEPCATSIASKPENAQKNRYPDNLPYDHNRVILNQHTNVSGSNYINASSITDHDPRNPAYIATQGPLAGTSADFWQLVWEQGSVVIVMLTRLTENGQALCHRYWPEEGSDLYHIYEVHLVSEHIWCDDYLVRSFYLKNVRTGETRTVTQFHFLSWPESGIPASTKALLEFRRKVNKSYRGRSCPIIVHCSDGIGRNGTYCLIDMVLNRMSKGTKEIDIAATLEHIRDQRPNMVKTKTQFEFVLMSVAEEVHAILKALPQ